MINDVSEDLQENLKQQIPTGELGSPTEIAALIEHLISDKASYITGQTLSINGGLFM